MLNHEINAREILIHCFWRMLASRSIELLRVIFSVIHTYRPKALQQLDLLILLLILAFVISFELVDIQQSFHEKWLWV